MEPRAPQLSATPEEHDAALAPTVAARKSTPIVALSEDPTLLEAMSSAALDQSEVIVSPSADRFIDQVVASGAELALIDAAAAPPGLAEFLVALHRQFPQLQLLLVGPGNVQHQVADQLADGSLFRFVHKPASAARLKLFIEAALRQRQARITQELVGAPLPTAGAAAMPQSPSGRPLWIAASLMGAVLIAIAGALLWHVASSSRQPSSVAAPPPPAHGLTPATRAPAAPDASAAAALVQQKEAEQEAIDRAAAQRAENDRIAAEEQEHVAASADQIRRAAAAAAQARADQIHLYVQLARSRIASGALVEPSDDSARTYVTTALRLAPDDETARAVALSLTEALTTAFGKALAAGDGAAAEHWLKASRSASIGEASLDQMSMQLTGLQVAQNAALAADQAVANADTSAPQPAQSPVPGPTTSITTVTTGASVVPSAQIVPESALQRLIFVAPTYPQEALMRGDTGFVELDFTVTPKGTVADVKVTASDPGGVFEESAIHALLRDRYQPVQRDGINVSQRAHIRLRFAL
jgi:TonB family protein